MPAKDDQIYIEVACAVCKCRLNFSMELDDSTINIRVSPCENCLSEARDEGENLGYENGMKDAQDDEETR